MICRELNKPVVVEEISRPAGLLLLVGGIGAALWVLVESLRLPRIARQRMFVVMTLTFFSVMFWAFFEQAGSSLNLFADRNIQRVNAERAVTADMVGQVLRLQPTQAQVGFHDGETLFTLTRLDELRAAHEKEPAFEVDWTVAPDNVGMVLAERKDETPASTYQAFNAAFILAFGLLLTMLWAWLGARGWEPSTPAKFALGILQVGLGFGAFWWGAQQHDARGLVALSWLVWGYLLHTTGELCLSPVGLSMVSKLAPRRMVSTVMGTWFLAIAFAQYLAAIISQFTGVSSGGDGAAQDLLYGELPADREHLAELHSYARQNQEDLEALRTQVEAEVEQVRQQRLTLHRAREQFSDLMLDDVVQSLDNPTREQLEQELIDLGLLEYCRPALERRKDADE